MKAFDAVGILDNPYFKHLSFVLIENKIVTIKVNRNDGNIPNIKITKKAIAFFQFLLIMLKINLYNSFLLYLICSMNKLYKNRSIKLLNLELILSRLEVMEYLQMEFYLE